MTKDLFIQEILKHSNQDELYQFIIDYAGKSTEFRQALDARFNPSQRTAGNKEAYADIVRAAFVNNPFTTRGRYRDWKDYGYDPEGVRDDLQLLLDKIKWYRQSGNFDEALLICQAMIETIPDEWEDQFDHDGNVQVMYDGAIEQLQEILDQDVLSKTQKENLFKWYHKESGNNKHKYVGINASLHSLKII